MFVQVYFHHTRRAYDRHVTKTLGFLLAEAYGDTFGQPGTFPPPTNKENVEEYLKWTDNRVFQAIDMDNAGPDGKLIRHRKHDRRVHETSLFPETKDMDYIVEILPELSEVDGWLDKADSSWYKFEKSADIRIATKDEGLDTNPVPLSTRSSLVKALEEVTQRRIYVPFERQRKGEQAS